MASQGLRQALRLQPLRFSLQRRFESTATPSSQTSSTASSSNDSLLTVEPEKAKLDPQSLHQVLFATKKVQNVFVSISFPNAITMKKEKMIN